MQSASEESENGKPVFDSNCITPGTAFMELLDRYMKYFIQRKVCGCVCMCMCVGVYLLHVYDCVHVLLLESVAIVITDGSDLP